MRIKKKLFYILILVPYFLPTLSRGILQGVQAKSSSSATVIIGEGGHASACFFCQLDPQWESGAIKSTCRQPVIKRNGCGPTSLAMILCAFGVDTNPTSMWNEFMNDGYLSTCASEWAAFTNIPPKHDLKVDSTIGTDWDIAKNFLDAGWLIIASSRMTTAGHIIVITDVRETAAITNDPGYCGTGEGKEYTKSYIKVSRMWAIKKV